MQDIKDYYKNFYEQLYKSFKKSFILNLQKSIELDFQAIDDLLVLIDNQTIKTKLDRRFALLTTNISKKIDIT